jgi:hypothetical protein
MCLLCQWRYNLEFNPSHLPHFGSLWEACIRSVKTYLKMMIVMTFHIWGNVQFDSGWTLFGLSNKCVLLMVWISYGAHPKSFPTLLPTSSVSSSVVTSLTVLQDLPTHDSSLCLILCWNLHFKGGSMLGPAVPTAPLDGSYYWVPSYSSRVTSRWQGLDTVKLLISCDSDVLCRTCPALSWFIFLFVSGHGTGRACLMARPNHC